MRTLCPAVLLCSVVVGAPPQSWEVRGIGSGAERLNPGRVSGRVFRQGAEVVFAGVSAGPRLTVFDAAYHVVYAGSTDRDGRCLWQNGAVTAGVYTCRLVGSRSATVKAFIIR